MLRWVWLYLVFLPKKENIFSSNFFSKKLQPQKFWREKGKAEENFAQLGHDSGIWWERGLLMYTFLRYFCWWGLFTAKVIVSDSPIWHYVRPKKVMLYQTKLTICLPELILCLPRLILYLPCLILNLPSPYNISIADIESDFDIWYNCFRYVDKYVI